MKRAVLRSCAVLAVLTVLSILPAPAAEDAPAPAAETLGKPGPEHEHVSGLEHAEVGHGGEEEDAAFIGRAEVFWVQPRRAALDYAIASPINSGRAVGTVVEVPWDATVGYRAGFGYRWPGTGWEVSVNYTYVDTSDTRTLSAPAGGTLYATLSQPTLAVFNVSTASADTQLIYHVVDVDIGRRVHVGEAMSVWLSGGPRFAWIKQDLTVGYDGQTANMAVISSPIKFYGGGLRVGGEGDWLLGKKVSLYARAYGSLLSGDFRTSLLETNGGGATVIVNLNDNFHKVVPVTELGMGVGWLSESVRFRVGYELTNWFGLVDSPDIVHDLNKLSRRSGDLNLEGLSASLELIY